MIKNVFLTILYVHLANLIALPFYIIGAADVGGSGGSTQTMAVLGLILVSVVTGLILRKFVLKTNVSSLFQDFCFLIFIFLVFIVGERFILASLNLSTVSFSEYLLPHAYLVFGPGLPQIPYSPIVSSYIFAVFIWAIILLIPAQKIYSILKK